MIADDDCRTADKTSVWILAFATVLGLVFAGSLLAVFLIGYFSVGPPPPDPVSPYGLPGSHGQLQPGDTITEIGTLDSPPGDLRDRVILGDGDELQIILEGQNSTNRFQPGDRIAEIGDTDSPSTVTDNLNISGDGRSGAPRNKNDSADR